MAWSSPRTWATGELVTATLMNQEIRDNFNAAFPLGSVDGAWPSWTPTLTQTGAVTKTVTYARYMKVGRTTIAAFDLAVTGTGTASAAVTVSLPVTAATSSLKVGAGSIFDTSAGTQFKGVVELASTTTLAFVPTETTVNNNLGATSFTAALASGDLVRGFAIFEAAS